MRTSVPQAERATPARRAQSFRRFWPFVLIACLAIVIIGAIATWSAVENAKSVALAQAQRDALQMVGWIGEVEPRLRTDESLVLGGLIALRNAGKEDCPMLPDGQMLIRISTLDNRTVGTPGWSPDLSNPDAFLEGIVPASACTGTGTHYIGVVQQIDQVTIVAGRTYRPVLGGVTFWLSVAAVSVAVLFAMALLALYMQRRQQYEFQMLAAQIDKMGKGSLSRLSATSANPEVQSVVDLVNRFAARIAVVHENMRRLQGFVTHDIGNPLLVAERLLERDKHALGDGGKGALEQLRLADKRRRDALELITASTQSDPSERAIVRPRQRIKSLIDTMFTYLAEDRNLSLHLEGDVGAVAAVPEQFDRMIENVLLNAVQHADEGSMIVIALVPEGSEALIEIRNAGKGVSVAMLERIFDEGVRDARPEIGHGIGLAITRAVAQSCEGTVRGRNTQDGFAVEIRLPHIDGDEE
ncbi:sensor histidine kinase [Parasphingorhabdus sp. DH2-15]|uniref:sensor histidine kinase n=1 Tax=Parasphingorhabdus sp. DH2-15 TaxID=3444112 RepID=UPI003F685102